MSEPIFLRNQLVSAGDLNDDYISPVMDISGALAFGIQLAYDGSPAGTFAVQISNDADALSSNLTTSLAADWTSLTLSSVPTLAGSGNWGIALAGLQFQAMRLNYTSTKIEGFTYVTVADVAGSLNNKYFFFSEVDGLDYYCWFNVNSAGVDPAIAGRTGVEVDLATGAANTTVATSVETAIEAATAIEITVTGHTGVAVQIAAGHVTAASAQNSGFTVTNQIAASTLTAIVTGKGV